MFGRKRKFNFYSKMNCIVILVFLFTSLMLINQWEIKILELAGQRDAQDEEVAETMEGKTKKAYLTFDDGPSEHTDKILDILKEKKVKATFFVVGKTDEKSKKRYQRILNEGHTLGMHSYSHDYDEIYGSIENYKKDIEKLEKLLIEVTGKKPTIYRFPGGSSNSVTHISMQECISYLEEKGITYYDWNVLNEDAVCPGATKQQLNANILKDLGQHTNAIILMHDLSQCDATVEALPELIDILKEKGYEMQKIGENTTPVQHFANRKARKNK